MCDYSIKVEKTRAAEVNDVLVVTDFKAGTRGFATKDDAETAICVLPGTEIAFEQDVTITPLWAQFVDTPFPPAGSRLARFRQIRKLEVNTHHDALEFSTGELVLLNHICEGTMARVLQLPVAPRTEAEVQEQTRASYVG
jgi:hypothetical protein